MIEMDGATSRYPQMACPHCGHLHDSFTSADDRAVLPVDGSWSLCVRCGSINVITVSTLGVGLRRPTPEEKAEAAADANIQRILRTYHRFRDEHPLP